MKKIITNIILGTVIFFTHPTINRVPADDIEITIVHYQDGEQLMDAKYYDPAREIILQDGKKYEIEIKALRQVNLESIIRDLRILTDEN